MQENDFERQLQQKMSGLKMEPANEVWQKVKETVTKKSKHKRRLFLMIVFFAGMAAMGYLLITQTQTQTASSVVKAAKNQRYPEPANPETPAKKQLGPGIMEPVSAIAQGHEINQGTSLTQPVAKRILNRRTGHFFRANNTSPQQSEDAPQIRVAGNQQNETHLTSQKKLTGNRNARFVTVQATPVQDTVENDLGHDQTDALNSGAEKTGQAPVLEKALTVLPKSADVKDSVVMDTVKEDQLLVTKNKPIVVGGAGKPGKSWHPVFSITVGRSFTRTGELPSNLAADYTSNIGTSGGNITGSSGGYAALTPGYSFALAAGVSRDVTKTLQWNAGLEYRLLTTNLKTGKQADSSLDYSGSIFTAGNSHSYNNRFHYIALPISLAANLFKIGNCQAQATAGITFSKMINTNALVYDSQQNLYHQQKSAFHSTNFALTGGFLFRIRESGKPMLSFGPEFYYSLTPLTSLGAYSGTHNGYWGIRIQAGF